MDKKTKLVNALGSSLEWFDFALYGFFSAIFAKNFFPEDKTEPLLALLITYSIFAIGFAARPLGGLIFGYIGDRYSRLYALRLTPLLIASTSLLLVIAPTYKIAGNFAILYLLLTRLLQGIFLGGEFAGNIVYLCESSPKNSYFWGSIGSCTASFGILLASITASSLYHFSDPEFLYSYGWRLAFLLSIPLSILAFFTRLKMSEPIILKTKKSNTPIFIAYKHHKKTLLYGFCLIALHAASFYFVFMFLPIYLNKVRAMPESAAIVNNSIYLTLHLLLIPLFGIMVNKIGGLKSNIIASTIFSLITIPCFALITYGDPYQILEGLLIFSIITAFNAAIIPGLLVKLIPEQIRYTLLALVFNLGFGLLGGSIPFISLLLIKQTQCKMSPSFYLTLLSLLTLVVSFIVQKGSCHNENREISKS